VIRSFQLRTGEFHEQSEPEGPEFDLALHLGCRRSNMYGQHNAKRAPMEPLQWSEVNLDFRVVTFQRSKSGKSYRVPINDAALAAFKKLRERSDGAGAVIRKPRPGLCS
jgi:integrase